MGKYTETFLDWDFRIILRLRTRQWFGGGGSGGVKLSVFTKNTTKTRDDSQRRHLYKIQSELHFSFSGVLTVNA